MSKYQDQIQMKARDAFEGKTVTKVEADACNSWTFYFGDGTKASIETECFNGSANLYGIVVSPP